MEPNIHVRLCFSFYFYVLLDLGHFRLDLLGQQAGKISSGQLIRDCFPDPKAAEDTQKTDEGAGKGAGEEQQVVAAEVHAEQTGE